MVRREMVSSRAHAGALITEGRVEVRGIPSPKAASLVSDDQPITIRGDEHVWVSRGAHKLLEALDRFSIDVRGRRAVDIGASTGGFTEALLARGADHVVAVDVGRAQLHERLRADTRVESWERTDIRRLDPLAVGAPFEIVVADLSFISLCSVAPQIAAMAASEADVVVLVKPPFEVGRRMVVKGGIVRDPEARAGAVRKVADCLRDAGLGVLGVCQSPIKGGDGNVEYLLWLRKGVPGLDDVKVPE